MINIVIPMAGLGSRFSQTGITLPKPLILVNGKTLVEHAVSSLNISGRYIFITRKYDDPHHNELLSHTLAGLNVEYEEIQIDRVTSGASETCLHAQEIIDNNDPLIITNCDQLLRWDSQAFLKFIDQHNPDGCVVLYKNQDPKNSFAVIENNRITKIAEKTPISDNALIGLHYWRQGRSFVQSGTHLVEEFRGNGLPECYVSETYNYMIEQGQHVAPYFVSKHSYSSLGTPSDVAIYQGKLKEFYSSKPKTIFCDLDGTILKHAHRYSDIKKTPSLLSDVLKKFDEWDSRGHTIVLTTARKVSAREITERQLHELGICWDHLIMGITSGVRVLINDKLHTDDLDRACAINVITDEGWHAVSWEDYSL